MYDIHQGRTPPRRARRSRRSHNTHIMLQLIRVAKLSHPQHPRHPPLTACCGKAQPYHFPFPQRHITLNYPKVCVLLAPSTPARCTLTLTTVFWTGKLPFLFRISSQTRAGALSGHGCIG